MREKIRKINPENHIVGFLKLGMKKSTVGAIIRKWKTYETTDILPRSGAPRKISPSWGQNDHKYCEQKSQNHTGRPSE